MTDAAVPVTESAVEHFTERYLRSRGCDIEKRGDHWTITVPKEINSEILTEGLTLYCGNDSADDDVELLHPDSSFFQRLLTEASQRSPTGRISIETADTETQIPGWLQNSDVEVKDAKFTPFYDRTALVVVFDVSIETVSDYQTELLRAVAVDTRSEEPLPTLEETFLQMISQGDETSTTAHSDTLTADVQSLLDSARQQLIERIQGTIDEVHQEASRAADAEVEEFRQLQQQRIEELEQKHSQISAKIHDLSEQINGGDEEERIEALKERKELKEEYEDIDAQLTDLRQRRDRGFPERQEEIRSRHALDVRVRPVTLTEVEYEQGEIEFELASEKEVRKLTLGYGSGVGVTETVDCDSCGESFGGENPLGSLSGGLRCESCSV